MLSVAILKPKFDQVIIWLALLYVPFYYLVVLVGRVWVLQLVLYHGEAGFEACSYHDVIGYIEYLKGRVRRLIDVKVEELKVGRRRHVAQCFCIHASPPVVHGYWRVLEIGYKKVAVILDQFAALIQQLFQHAVVVDES